MPGGLDKRQDEHDENDYDDNTAAYDQAFTLFHTARLSVLKASGSRCGARKKWPNRLGLNESSRLCLAIYNCAPRVGSMLLLIWCGCNLRS